MYIKYIEILKNVYKSYFQRKPKEVQKNDARESILSRFYFLGIQFVTHKKGKYREIIGNLEIFEKFSYNLIYKNKKYIIRKNYRYKFKNIISKMIIVMKLYK